MVENKKREVKFAPEMLDREDKKADLEGGRTLKIAPLNPTIEQVKKINEDAYVEATMSVEPKAPTEKSKFAPRSTEFTLPSGSGVVTLRRIALHEEGLFRALRGTMMQYLPYVEAGNLRGITSMYQSISDTITRVVEACMDSDDLVFQNLPLLDKTAMFYKIIELTYGAKHKLPVEPDSDIMVEVDLSQLAITYAQPEDLEKKIKLTHSFDGESYVVVTMPSIANESLFYGDDVFAQIFAITKNIVIDGEELSSEEKAEAINCLHPEDVAAIEDALETFKNFGINITTKVAIGRGKKKQDVDYTVTLESILTYIVGKK